VNPITPEITILEVICQHRQTEEVFRKYDAAAGTCLCCQALFDFLAEVARKYGLELEKLLPTWSLPPALCLKEMVNNAATGGRLN
jgi:hypothetical protein